MGDGHLGKCKDCAKKDCKTSNGKHERKCIECSTSFRTTGSEITKGGGLLCSRSCYYIHQRKTIKKEELSHAWRGDKVGKGGIHNWVQRHRGKPRVCEKCRTTEAKQYDWANISQEYKRDLSDWIRLCRSCHAKYDYKTRYEKWKKAVRKLGWKVKK